MEKIPTPKTNEEKFLYAISSGDNSDLPTPRTIREAYLKEIAKNGIGVGGNGNVFVGNIDEAPATADVVIDNSDEGMYLNELITTPIIDSTLTLTKNKYQTTTMEDNTSIVLPTVDKFTEIHLFFDTASELTLILPSIKWQGEVNIEANKTYEFIFTYTDKWIAGCVCYE